MKVSVSEKKGLDREMVVSIPAKEIDPKVEERLKTAATQVRMPGFRPGKVPVKLVKQRYGKAVRQEVIGEILQKSYFDAVGKEKLRPAGMPKIDIVTNEDGKDLEFKATFEVLPEIKVNGLEKIAVEKPICSVVDADLDKMLETLQKQHVEWASVKRAAKLDDRVVIDFEGFINKKAFDGGKAENTPLVLGSGSMIKGFEEGIVGAKPGDDIEVNVTFPKDYHVKDLAGKEAMFKIKVKEVQDPKLPELNEAFAKKFNMASLDKLKKEVRANMERELEFTIKTRIKNQVIEGLLEHNKELEMPKSLLHEEIHRIKDQTLSRIGEGGKKPQKLPELPDSLFEEQATRRVKLGLLMGQIIADHKLKADPKKVKAMIEKMASVYEDADQVVKHYYQNPQQLAEIEQIVLEEQAVDKVLESAKVTEKKQDFTEVMQGKK